MDQDIIFDTRTDGSKAIRKKKKKGWSNNFFKKKDTHIIQKQKHRKHQVVTWVTLPSILREPIGSVKGREGGM